ncbi:MAG: L,D-transpeptidase family protein [Thermodesulfobacteriota bacterium]
MGIAFGLVLALSVAAHGAIAAEVSSTAQTDDLGQAQVVVHCALRVLQVWQGPDLIREFPVETGKGGIGKTKSGDHRTPLGDYRVGWMASRHSPKGFRIKDGTSWCSGNKFVYGSSGPALEKLWSQSYGGLHAVVINIDYPNSADRAKGYTGDCIHIHATKRLKNGTLPKSHGCINMFPQDALELYDLVDVGTRVKVLP